ncbi:hypothetical protein BDQ17DRAFT_1477547 [Cyathus striatus]|nr:hypothetical protein BDQ17DRAFT_1477547 [Cyathus striatus]
MSQDNCALNQDGSLKDASEIQWFNDIDDETLLLQPRPSKTNLKPSKTKRARLASFLDLEAEVASGSKDEDPIDSDDNKDNNIDRSRLSLTQAIEAEHGFIDHLTNKYVEKSRCIGNYSGRDGDPMFSTHKHSIARSGITPQDWPMFDIPVKPSVGRIRGNNSPYAHNQAGPKHIRSAFASAMIPGHVYVEGHNLEDVKSVRLSIAKLSPIGFVRHLLRAGILSQNYRQHTFLPSILGIFKVEGCASATLRLIQRRPRREISPGKLLVQYEDAEKKVIKGYIFQNSQYTLDGFIVHRKLDTDDYYQVDAMPTINELRSFEKCRQIPADVMELSRCTSLSSNIKIGDQVKIMLEGGKEYLAFVEDIEGENASLNLVEFPMQVFSQSLELLQKFFKVGDGVRVKSGEHKGRVGMVTTVECNGKIGDKTITFVTFPLGEITVMKCNEVPLFGGQMEKMQVDPYRYQYGKYAWLKLLERTPNLHWAFVRHHAGNMILGLGLKHPWNPSSMTPQVASASSDVSAELFAFAHHIPENTASCSPCNPLQLSLPQCERLSSVKALLDNQLHLMVQVIGEEVIHEIPPEFVQPTNFHEFRNTYQISFRVHKVLQFISESMGYRVSVIDKRWRVPLSSIAQTTSLVHPIPCLLSVEFLYRSRNNLSILFSFGDSSGQTSQSSDSNKVNHGYKYTIGVLYATDYNKWYTTSGSLDNSDKIQLSVNGIKSTGLSHLSCFHYSIDIHIEKWGGSVTCISFISYFIKNPTTYSDEHSVNSRNAPSPRLASNKFAILSLPPFSPISPPLSWQLMCVTSRACNDEWHWASNTMKISVAPWSPLDPLSLVLQASAFKDNNQWRACEVDVSYNGWHPVGYEYVFGTAEEMGTVPARGDDVDYLNTFNTICRGFAFVACLRMSARDALWCHVAEVARAVIIDLLETLLSRGKWPEQLKFHTTTHAHLGVLL